MNNFYQLLRGLDTQPLLDKLALHPALWDVMTVRQDFEGSPHRDTRCIVLRGPRTLDPAAAMSDTECVPYLPAAAMLADVVGPLLAALAEAAFLEQGTTGRIMLVELKPGGEITPHRDEGTYAKAFSRFHICLSGVSAFYCGRGKETDVAYMAAGDAWWFNHREPHRVIGIGARPRVHLIVDAISPRFEVDQTGD